MTTLPVRKVIELGLTSHQHIIDHFGDESRSLSSQSLALVLTT